MQRCQELQSAAGITAPLNYFVEKTSEAIESADCFFMVSGSISLELLARRKPGIVLYRLSSFSHYFSQFLLLCRYITLTNLIAEDQVMPEFFSSGNPENDIQKMTAVLTEWLQKPETLAARKDIISRLADRVTNIGATQRTADFLLSQPEAQTGSPVASRKAA
jgi:lipid-A-disaccharide synthase